MGKSLIRKDRKTKKGILDSIDKNINLLASYLKIYTDNSEQLLKNGLQNMPYDNVYTLEGKMASMTTNVYNKQETEEKIQKEIEYDKKFNNFVYKEERAEEAFEIIKMVQEKAPKDKYETLELAERINKLSLKDYKRKKE